MCHPPHLVMESEQQQDMMVAISSELPPPEEPKRKDKKWRKHPRKGALTKRPPPRPYKRLEEPKLELRIQKLTARMERAKRQVRIIPDRASKRGEGLRISVSFVDPRLTPSSPTTGSTRTPGNF